MIAVFKQAAGANADQILKRIADYGVAGRKTALDADMFTSPGLLPCRTRCLTPAVCSTLHETVCPMYQLVSFSVAYIEVRRGVVVPFLPFRL